MRKIVCLPLVAAVCAFASLRADVTIVTGCRWDNSPEHGGFLNMDVLPGDGELVRVTMIKGGRMRIDNSAFKPKDSRGPSEPAQSEIMDFQSGEMILLMPDMKLAIKEPMAEFVHEAMKQPPSDPADGGTPLTPAGKKETISGCPADEYTCALAGRKVSVWLTKAAPHYANIVKQLSDAYAQGQMAAWLRGSGLDMNPLPGGLPVRIVYQSRSGEVRANTVLSISSKPIADSEFQIPANYKQADQRTTRPR